MSRYIDADALDKAFSKLRFNNDGELNHYGDRPNWYLWGSEIENLIADAPSIDIVFCKECYMCDEEMWCSFYDSIMESDDFCSYGEREGE